MPALCFFFILAQLATRAVSLRTSGSGSRLHAGRASETQITRYLIQMIDRYKRSADMNRKAVARRHVAEALLLETTLNETLDEKTKSALKDSLAHSKKSVAETDRIYGNMVAFSDSMENLLQAAAKYGSACEETMCGAHASCTDTTEGPQCVCNEGYVGNVRAGQDCYAPPEFRPHRLLHEGQGGFGTHAADMSVSVFGENKIAVVFRDVSRDNRGVVVTGSVREAGMVDLATPEEFTAQGGKAFDPVVGGTPSRRIAIAWRDADRHGACWMRSAQIGGTGIRGASMAKVWGAPMSFCRGQSHKMSMVPFSNERLAVMFSDKVVATQHTPTELFGNSLLVQLDPRGSIVNLGKFRFADSAVCRLEVTQLSATGFVLGARASRAAGDLETAAAPTRQEAMAVYGELVDDELVFSPNAMNLEPQGSQIWARGLSLIAPDTFAYSYQAGASNEIKMAVVAVDPVSHQMSVLRHPTVVHPGFSPYVGMISVPYTPTDPHTLVYYEAHNTSRVSICSWVHADKMAKDCEEYTWLTSKLSSISGVHLGGGKTFMVFAAESTGAPYYGVFGLSKK